MLGAAHVDDVVDDVQPDENGPKVDDPDMRLETQANDNDNGDESDEREKEAHMQ